MDKEFVSFLARSILTEFVSVFHDYDTMETRYSFPYNASLASNRIKLMLIHAFGLDQDEDFDETDPEDIKDAAANLISDITPLFELAISHSLNKQGEMLTHYSLYFDDAFLCKKTNKTNKPSPTNVLFKLAEMCSSKIVIQEVEAQKEKLEKTFISTNLFSR